MESPTGDDVGGEFGEGKLKEVDVLVRSVSVYEGLEIVIGDGEERDVAVE